MRNIESYDFEMFSKAGNNACRSLVKKVIKKINGKNRVTKEGITEYCYDLIKDVAKKHREITDTEPEWHIAELVSESLKDVGYEFRVSRYDF
jgi:hypothetical protein